MRASIHAISVLCWPVLAVVACSGAANTGTSGPQGGSGDDASNTVPEAGGQGAPETGGGDGGTQPPAPEGGPGPADVVTVDTGTPTSIGDPSLPRRLLLENRCTYTVWADALPKTTLPGGVPLEIASGQAFSVGWPDGWSGRVWGRTGCTTSGTSFKCAADKFVSNSLAEFTLAKTAGQGTDWYDVSLVDGFNIPIGILNVGHTENPSKIYACGSPVCAVDLLPGCPAPLQAKDATGAVVACKNDACKVLGGNDAGSPACQYPNQYTEYFKTACPTSYSWPYDDPTSTFTCGSGKDYAVVFCPTQGAQPGLP